MLSVIARDKGQGTNDKEGCSGGIEPAASTFTGSHAEPLHHKHQRGPVGPERKGRELNPQGSSLNALAPRCRRQSASPSRWSRTRDLHPPQYVLQTYASLLGLCDMWGDVPESNRRCLDHSQASWPLDEHPHKLRRKESNLRTPIPKTGVCTSTNYSASNGAAARAQTSNRAFRRRLRCSLAPRRRMVHLAGLELALRRV